MQELVIEAGPSERHYWQDLWRYRELPSASMARCFGALQTDGDRIAWPLIRPFLMMVVFTIIVGKVAKLPSDSTAPYVLKVFASLPPWSFFSSALSDTSKPAQQRASISKVYFPGLIVPIAAMVMAVVGLLHRFPHSGGNDGLV